MHIYLIVNHATGKYYVGQHKGSSLQKYLISKLWDAEHQRNGQSYLYASMRKHGRAAFTIHSLLSDIQTKAELDQYEKDFIKFLRARDPEYGYNICKGGEGFTGPHSLKTRERFSQRMKEWWSDPKTLDIRTEVARKVSEARKTSAKPLVNKVCPVCNKPFVASFSDREMIFCSFSCSSIKKGTNSKRLENQRAAMALPGIRVNLSKAQQIRRQKERETGVLPLLNWNERRSKKRTEERGKRGPGMPSYQKLAISKALKGLVCDENRKSTLELGRHTRWHKSRGIINSTCQLCSEGETKA